MELKFFCAVGEANDETTVQNENEVYTSRLKLTAKRTVLGSCHRLRQKSNTCATVPHKTFNNLAGYSMMEVRFSTALEYEGF